MRTEQAATTKSQTCPTCSMPQKDWPTPSGFDGVHCSEACAKGEQDESGGPKLPSPDEGARGNRPTQQRDQGTNRGNVDANRQRESTGQPRGSKPM